MCVFLPQKGEIMRNMFYVVMALIVITVGAGTSTAQYFAQPMMRPGRMPTYYGLRPVKNLYVGPFGGQYMNESGTFYRIDPSGQFREQVWLPPIARWQLRPVYQPRWR